MRGVADVEITGRDGSGYKFIKSNEKLERAFRSAGDEVARWLKIQGEGRR